MLLFISMIEKYVFSLCACFRTLFKNAPFTQSPNISYQIVEIILFTFIFLLHLGKNPIFRALLFFLKSRFDG